MTDGILLVLRAVVAFPLGFFLPGFFISHLLLTGHGRAIAAIRWATAFLISLLVLFQIMFLCVLIGLPLRAMVIWPLELLVTIPLAIWWLRRPVAEPTLSTGPQDKSAWEWVLIGLVCTVVAALLLRTCLWPLAGDDNPVRWDYLATRILKFQNLSFYPPLSGPDFRKYFYPDGMAPVVSFAYWWIYASVGRYSPALTGLVVTAQYAAILAFVYGLARKMHSPGAGTFAIAALASSTLFNWSVAIGQETGLTALALAAMMYFLVAARDVEQGQWRWMILAGCAAGMGALAREYGCAYLILGAVALFWMRQSWRMVMIFGATFAVVAAPWYLRNLIRTGNPVYNIEVGPFYVTPVHAGLFAMYVEKLGVSKWGPEQWKPILSSLIQGAELQMSIGFVAMIWLIRKWGFVTVAALLMVAAWLKSVGYTNGGALYSMRVLSPVLALSSVLIGVFLASLAVDRAVQLACIAVLICTGAIGLFVAALHPSEIDRSVLDHWGQIMFAVRQPTNGWREQLPQILPAGSAVLTESPYVATPLSDAGIDAVPVWSPEVAFLTNDSIEPKEARRRLLQLGIHYVVAEKHINMDYLITHMRPFYHDDSPNWRIIQAVPDQGWVFELPEDR